LAEGVKDVTGLDEVSDWAIVGSKEVAKVGFIIGSLIVAAVNGYNR
jgi:hypothetical protein